MNLFHAAVEDQKAAMCSLVLSRAMFLGKSKGKGCAREVMSTSINGGDVTVSGYMKYTLPDCCSHLLTIDVHKR